MTRQKYLDHLRAFSAICVIAIHTTGPFFRASGVWTPTGIAGGLIDTTVRVGLPLFFMISGALLLAQPPSSPAAFYRRRLPRVVVPFVLYSAAYYVYVHTVERPGPMSIGDFAMALLSAPQYYHLWFVYTLIGIYLFTPFLAQAVQGLSQRSIWGCIVVLIVVLQLKQLGPLFGIKPYESFFIANAWVIYFGAGYAITRLEADKHRRFFLALAAVGFVATFVARGFKVPIGVFDQGLNMYLLAFGAFGLFASMQGFAPEHSLPDRIVSTIGKYSYEVYLVHPLVIIFLRDKVFEMGYDHPIWNTFALTSTVLCGSLAVALLIQTFVSAPILRVLQPGRKT